MYKRQDLRPELAGIEGNDDEIKERFALALKFGTAGLRGVLGAGTNRMNIYVVRQATQGLANWVKTQGGSQTVAISYDSRLKSDVFAKTAAGVLAANDIQVRIYDALMPVPALSFATRYYKCNAGVMVTASHNPAKYNGYKAYGPDGCQLTDDAAAVVYEEIQKTDVLTGAKYMSFAEGVEKGLIHFVGCLLYTSSIKSCINIKQSCCNAYDTGYDRADHESHGNSKGNACIHKCASETICPDISSDKDGSENGDEQSEHWKQEVDQTKIVIFRQFHVFFRNQWSQSFRKRLACLGTTFFFFIHRSDIQSEDGY